MRDPVLQLEDGITYERQSLPESSTVVENVALRNSIADFLVRMAREAKRAIRHQRASVITSTTLTATVLVKSIVGVEVLIPLRPDMRVLDLKTELRRMEGIPVEQQRFVFGGRQLEEDRLLSDYNIQADSVVYVVLRLRGGMLHPSSGRVNLNSYQNDQSWEVPYDVRDLLLPLLDNYILIPSVHEEDENHTGGGGGGGGGGGER